MLAVDKQTARLSDLSVTRHAQERYRERIDPVETRVPRAVCRLVREGREPTPEELAAIRAANRGGVRHVPHEKGWYVVNGDIVFALMPSDRNYTRTAVVTCFRLPFLPDVERILKGIEPPTSLRGVTWVPPRVEHCPWDEWLDGVERLVRPGEDFRSTCGCLARRALKEAAKRKRSVEIRFVSNGVRLKATPL